MGLEKPSDFVVESKGHCFLCLDKISSSEFKIEAESFPVYSLLYLSRFLKIDMTKVFGGLGSIPQHLVTKVERSNLKVELCENCATWNNTFSKLYQKLEKIAIEVRSHLNDINVHGELVTGKRREQQRLVEFTDVDAAALSEKLGVAQVLRKDTIEKYSRKITNVRPRVKIRRLTQNEINAATLKSKPSSRFGGNVTKTTPHFGNLSYPKMEISEIQDSDTLSDGGGNDYMNYLEDNFEQGQLSGTNIKMEVEYNYKQEKCTICHLKVHDNSTHTCVVPSNSKFENSRKTGKGGLNQASRSRHACKVCGKGFVGSSGLRVHHRNIHLKIRVQCAICSKLFTQRSNLLLHIKSIHNGERFKCKFCSKSFSHMAGRSLHMRLNKCVQNQ